MSCSAWRTRGGRGVTAATYATRLCAASLIEMRVIIDDGSWVYDRVGGARGPRQSLESDVVSNCGEVAEYLRSLYPKPEKATGGTVYRPPVPSSMGGVLRGEAMREWENAETRPLPLGALGERYRRYRLADPGAEEAMARSLRGYGQASPVTACWRSGRAELLDGFKRRAAAMQLGWAALSVRVVDVDERAAKAAILGLNSVGARPSELEEAWLVQALVREDGLQQVEAAQLLNKHKSWVSRRLALLERLGGEAQAEMRLGMLSVGLARQLTRLPTGNQTAVLATARRESLTTVEVQHVIDLLAEATPEQERLLLDRPREALLQAQGVSGPVRDCRLSPAGNRLARQLGMLLDALGRLENWQRHPGLAELKRDDRRMLAPQFARLARDARSVANLVDEVWQPESSAESS
jgi:ParB-like chromosome segregation protein Spo0J